MEHTDHTAAGRPLTEQEANTRARRLITEAYSPTSYRDDSPVPAYGTAAPVAQPGRPPMSQRATDASGLMLSGSVAALSVGGATSLVLYTLGQVDPVTLAVGAAGPVALVLAVGSLLRSAGRAKADMHTEHHHHYRGSVRQENTTVSSTTKGLFAKNRNDVR
ncbi:hypothetical protein ACFWSF_32245 [Streptomyces sp. NPDC058611]|uniref:hypothetical protein n=1 Tax=unclassified Streptomyces TaxID=2593676 RepID=UPI00365646FD